MTLEEKRALHKRWSDAADVFLRTGSEREAFLALDRECRAVLGPVIPHRIPEGSAE